MFGKAARALGAVFLAALVLSAAGISSAAWWPFGGRTKEVVLNGTGASFPNPLYQKWIEEYTELYRDVKINYQSLGSGAGKKQIIERTVDFAGSDSVMKDDELARAPAPIYHIPTALGAVVVTYNLAGVPTGLKLTPDVVADIFLGKITRWNDSRITSLNPGVRLPAAEIAVVHRSDGSGTTNIFTDYLSAVSPEWAYKVGTGTSVNWPVGLGAKGNEGVSGQVKQLPNSVGYVELTYALQNKLPYAFIQNKAGKFVEPSLASVSAAAVSALSNIPSDYRISLVNTSGTDSYPISAFTYLLIYKNYEDKEKGEALAKFVWWAVHDGQKYAPALYYAPLPEGLVKKLEVTLKTLNYRGTPFLK